MITHEEVHEVKWPIHDEVVLPAKSKDEKKNVCFEVHENTVAENEKHEETLNHKEKLIQLSEESKSQEKHWHQNQTEILLKNMTSEHQRPLPQPPLPLLLATVYDKNISNTPVTVITNTSTDINNLSI
ncbi:uncharacterized protein LOC126900542 isoform X2 [Daktulosphaira vitifoliae]|nr:uncharacterized protein LOC126900542 isoform X2 [Daktulosphaira vitifoliae]